MTNIQGQNIVFLDEAHPVDVYAVVLRGGINVDNLTIIDAVYMSVEIANEHARVLGTLPIYNQLQVNIAVQKVDAAISLADIRAKLGVSADTIVSQMMGLAPHVNTELNMQFMNEK